VGLESTIVTLEGVHHERIHRSELGKIYTLDQELSSLVFFYCVVVLYHAFLCCIFLFILVFPFIWLRWENDLEQSHY